jgi:hypothetical protein
MLHCGFRIPDYGFFIISGPNFAICNSEAFASSPPKSVDLWLWWAQKNGSGKVDPKLTIREDYTIFK